MNKSILLLFQERNKLRAISLYHLVKGKRSSSILLFGFFNNNLQFSGLFPRIKEDQFFNQLQSLKKASFLEEEADVFYLTDQGRKERQKLCEILSVENINFFRFGRSAAEAWQLIKFGVQAISYLNAEISDYLPLETDVFSSNYLKSWLMSRPKRVTLAEVPQELKQIFNHMKQQDADFLANQFSGFMITGLVDYQLETQQAADLNFLFSQQALHHFLAELEKIPNSLLYDLVHPILLKNQNQSMLKTKQLFCKGYSSEEIQKVRNLKKGTIQDHLIEWAVQDVDFPFEKFVSATCMQRLSTLEQLAGEWHYRELYQQEPLDYLEFRLYQIQKFREEDHEY